MDPKSLTLTISYNPQENVALDSIRLNLVTKAVKNLYNIDLKLDILHENEERQKSEVELFENKEDERAQAQV